MNYTLYNRVGSAGVAIEAALTVAELPFELIEIDSKAGEPLPESFKQVNPWGQVPALKLPDGEIVTEVAAILCWLLAAHPDRGVGPRPGGDGYARYLRWVTFAAVNVHEAGSRMIYGFRFTTDPDGEAAIREAAEGRLKESLAVLDEAVAPGPFLLGDTMTAADIYIAMFYGWHHKRTNAPYLQRLYDGVTADPRIATIFERHRVRK